MDKTVESIKYIRLEVPSNHRCLELGIRDIWEHMQWSSIDILSSQGIISQQFGDTNASIWSGTIRDIASPNPLRKGLKISRCVSL